MSSIAKPPMRSLGNLIGGAAYGRAFRRIEPALDADAAKYLAAVEAADKQVLEDGVKRAVSAFVRGCKSDNIWDAIKASCILCGARTLAGALVPLKGTAPTKYNFVGTGTDYSRSAGLIGDGSTKYLDSNRANNADPQNSQHLSFYASQIGSTATGYIGSGAGQTNGISQLYVATADNIVTRSQSATASGQLFHTIGFIGSSRAASNSYIVRANSNNNTISTNSQAPNSVNLIIFNIPTLSYYSDARCSFYSIGESLDLALLDSRVSTLVAAIGAAV